MIDHYFTYGCLQKNLEKLFSLLQFTLVIGFNEYITGWQDELLLSSGYERGDDSNIDVIDLNWKIATLFLNLPAFVDIPSLPAAWISAQCIYFTGHLHFQFYREISNTGSGIFYGLMESLSQSPDSGLTYCTLTLFLLESETMTYSKQIKHTSSQLQDQEAALTWHFILSSSVFHEIKLMLLLASLTLSQTRKSVCAVTVLSVCAVFVCVCILHSMWM